MSLSLHAYLSRPLAVGTSEISTRLFLAPMTYLGHIAYRRVLADMGGCGLMFTEMCSAKTIPHENPAKSAFFTWRPEELPHLVCQLLGNDPEIMAQAAQRVATEGFCGVDINFGCAIAGICKRNLGAALLKDPLRAQAIVAAVRRAVDIPLWVKFRSGWEDRVEPVLELGRRFADAGADALTLHPRVAPDRRSRPPRWNHIRQLKETVAIPVIGNGDVFTRQDAHRMIAETGCDGIALGRIAIARPWVFNAWTTGLSEQAGGLFLPTALEILSQTARYFDAKTALRRYQRFIQYFAASFQFGHTLHSRMKGALDLDACQRVLYDFFQTNPRLLSRPNLNLFV